MFVSLFEGVSVSVCVFCVSVCLFMCGWVCVCLGMCVCVCVTLFCGSFFQGQSDLMVISSYSLDLCVDESLAYLF